MEGVRIPAKINGAFKGGFNELTDQIREKCCEY